MKSVSLATILFAVSILMFAETAVAETSFDGTWSVTTNVHDYKNPNGTMSRAYTWQFPMTVKNGVRMVRGASGVVTISLRSMGQ
jgi:hypothetical protein